ncbi:MAG: hypothetical protein ACK54F_01230 [Planctomycetia bacterium]
MILLILALLGRVPL